MTPVQNLLTLLLGIVLGLLLYRFVEMPTRRWQLRPSRRFALGTVAVSCCVVGVPVAMAAGFASGIDYDHVRRANDGFSGECVFETRFSPKPACQRAEKPAVLVWGDSFAMHLVPGVAAVSDRGVAQATRGNCAPVERGLHRLQRFGAGTRAPGGLDRGGRVVEPLPPVAYAGRPLAPLAYPDEA